MDTATPRGGTVIMSDSYRLKPHGVPTSCLEALPRERFRTYPRTQRRPPLQSLLGDILKCPYNRRRRTGNTRCAFQPEDLSPTDDGFPTSIAQRSSSRGQAAFMIT
ncbi:jg20298 [Pararge aegeria aegeria]|uniref:Jg20298 protein n=1 Tax=Pararge aegeria aegeria TaxID=348720 RepID=A0A8S4RGR7_9NEOP|nr:jg20298 [Pararge aegeria aegeria]